MRSPCRLLFLYAVVVIAFVAARLVREPYDDSYFFKRIALHLLDHGTLAWNVAEGPVFGVTSQLFQLAAVVIAALTRDHYILSVRVVLSGCLLFAYWQLWTLTRDRDRGLAATYAMCSAPVLYTTLSGMETALLFAFLAAFLCSVYAQRGEQRLWLAPVLALAVGLIRPDALLLVAPVLLMERWRGTRRLPLREIAILAAGGTLALSVFRWAYGSFLPLPFYAKNSIFSPYDAHFLSLSAQVQHVRFGLFVAVALPLVIVSLRRFDATNRVLLGSVLVYETYLYFTIVEVMGMQARFYAPALPLLALSAARALALPSTSLPSLRRVTLIGAAYVALLVLMTFAKWSPVTSRWGVDRVDAGLCIAAVLSAFLLLAACAERVNQFTLATGVALVTTCLAVPGLRFVGWSELSDNAYLNRHVEHVSSHRGMDALLRCVGDRIHVYHSEVGVTGLRFLEGNVTDLAGLLSPRWLFRGDRRFDDFCEQDRPEAIFLPHRNYRNLNREILSGSCITHYQRVIERSSSPLYVREDLVGKYRACHP
ncbi:MAG: hypothetical protein ACOY0T_39705 [Myxococcota bacterium]